MDNATQNNETVFPALPVWPCPDHHSDSAIAADYELSERLAHQWLAEMAK